jgi:predicted RNA methylase
MKQYWSLTEGVFNCLLDRRRTLAFRRAIMNTVSPDDVVVDLGSGSGIMAMFAAQAGAKKVYAVERDPKNARWLKTIFAQNGFARNIELVVADARSVTLPHKADVIICEMIATGLIEELQIPVMNNILKSSRTNPRVILESFENYVEAVHVREQFYGFKIPLPQYQYPGETAVVVKSITRRHLYRLVKFTRGNKPDVNIKADLIALKAGIVNAIRISNRSIFCDGSAFGASFAYSYPIILPVPPLEVKRSDMMTLCLAYQMCEGFQSLRYSVVNKT